MKKVLLATTSLAMTAGMAAADVSLSGYAEIGIADNGSEVVFFNDIDVKFTLSGETDAGLAFGATIDLDEVGDDGGTGINPTNVQGSDVEEQSVFVSGSFGTITMGDTDGALDWAMTETVWGTTIDDSHTAHAGFNGNAHLDGGVGGQIARYDYSFGDFAFAVSYEIGGNTAAEDEIFGVGAKYASDFGSTRLAFGVGYQDGELCSPGVATAGGTVSCTDGSGDVYGVSVSADFAGGFSVRANYSRTDGTVDVTGATTLVGASVEWDHWAIGVRYVMDELSVEANYGMFDGELAGTDFEADGFGVAFNYDLGGGAFVMVGYGDGDGFATSGGTPSGTETWSAGLGLNF